MQYAAIVVEKKIYSNALGLLSITNIIASNSIIVDETCVNVNFH